MSLRTRTTYKTLYGSSGTTFPDNTTAEISEGDMRTFGEDNADTFVLNSDLAVTSVSTASSTITLAFASAVKKTFNGSASFAGPKTIAHSNDSLAVELKFLFEITNVAAVLTPPASYLMSDPRFDGTDWTPLDTGKYKMVGDFDGTNWSVEILGPYV